KKCLAAAKHYAPSELEKDITGLYERMKSLLEIKENSFTLHKVTKFVNTFFPKLSFDEIVSILKYWIYHGQLSIDWNVPLEEAKLSLDNIPIVAVYQLPDVSLDDSETTNEQKTMQRESECESFSLTDIQLSFIQPLIDRLGAKATREDIRVFTSNHARSFNELDEIYRTWKRQIKYEKRWEKIKPIVDKFGKSARKDDIFDHCTASLPDGLGMSLSEKGEGGKGRYEGWPKKAIKLYKLYLRYKKHGKEGLVPVPKGEHDKYSLHHVVENFLQETINEWYTGTFRQKKAAYIEFANDCKIARERGQVPVEAWIPSYRTFLRRIKELPSVEKLGKHTPTRAKVIDKGLRGTYIEGMYPGAVIFMDHTQADIWVIDDFTKQPYCRPWITLAIDVFSRSIWGIFVSENAPSQESVTKCILNGFTSKQSLEEWQKFETRALQAGIVPDRFTWQASGLPVRIQVDNSYDFRAKSVKNLCMKLNITLEFRRVKGPQQGGFVESAWDTINDAIRNDMLPGRVFPLPKTREARSSVKFKSPPGYNGKKSARMTMEQFKDWLHDYIITRYSITPHGKQKHSPNELWIQGLRGDKYQVLGGALHVLKDHEYFDRSDYESKIDASCLLRSTGLRFENVFYSSKWLRDARKKSKYIRDGDRIHFKISNHDRRYAWVIDPEKNNVKTLNVYNYDGDDRIKRLLLQGLGHFNHKPFTVSKKLIDLANGVIGETEYFVDDMNVILANVSVKFERGEKLNKQEIKLIEELRETEEGREDIQQLFQLYSQKKKEMEKHFTSDEDDELEQVEYKDEERLRKLFEEFTPKSTVKEVHNDPKDIFTDFVPKRVSITDYPSKDNLLWRKKNVNETKTED
ncbi:MAG: integrase catalytic domain-containing protein, partial [Candidatus Hodarchaeales archaeon]